MITQQPGKRFGILHVPVHPHTEGLDAADQQIGIKRLQNSAGGILNKMKPLGQLLCFYDRQPGDHIAVAAQIFGSRVQNNVCTQLQGPLKIRGHKGVIHNQERVVAVRDLGGRRKIGHCQQRVCRAFDQHSLYIRRDGGFQRF